MTKLAKRKGATASKTPKTVIDHVYHDKKPYENIWTDAKGRTFPPKIISVINQKGGVGKTTTALNLGAALASRKMRVLLIDLDIQCNLTHMTVGDLEEGEPSICEAMLELTGFDKIIRATNTPNLDIVPAGDSLSELDIQLTKSHNRAMHLKICLDKTQKLSEYDVVLIDNPPFISTTTINSLTASSYYLVPLSCEYLPLLGYKWLNKTVNQVYDYQLNLDLKPLGVLLTMYDPRQSITGQVEGLVRSQLKQLVFDTKIRINTKIKAAPIYKKTILEYEDFEGKGTDDFYSLASEVVRRLVNDQADGDKNPFWLKEFDQKKLEIKKPKKGERNKSTREQGK